MTARSRIVAGRSATWLLSRWPILSSMNHLLPKMALTNQYHQQRAND